MNHTLKSLLATTILTLPAIFAATELTDAQQQIHNAVGIDINVQDMREIRRSSEVEATLDAASVTQIDVVATLQLLFRELDTATFSEQSRLNGVYDQLVSSQIDEAAKQRALARYHSIYRNVEHYLNGIIDYKPYVRIDLVTFQNVAMLGTFVIIHILLLKYGSFYYAVAPFAGGVTLYVYNQLLQGFSQAIKDGLIKKFEGPKSKIHRQWAGRISASKPALTDLLTYTLLHTQSDFSPGQLAKKMDVTFLSFSTFVKVFEELSSKEKVIKHL